jgi:hypothetical protein
MLFSPSTVPAFARNNELSDTAKALTGGNASGSTTKRISIKGGVFRLVAGGKEIATVDERYLDIIIVKAAPKVSRIFYGKSYDADNITGPDCWSNDGETPETTIETPQFYNCAGCPQNQAGSGNGNSRACRFQQRLAVVLENNPDGDVLQLTLPATSIFGKEDGDRRGLQAYARYLAAQSPPVNPEQIVTRMKFDIQSESPKLTFQPQRWLTEEEYEVSLKQGTNPDADRAVVMTAAQADGVKPTPMKIAGAAPKPVAKPMGEMMDEDDTAAVAEVKTTKAKTKAVADEEDEPEVRKDEAKPSAVPAKKAKLADIVSEWDDE